MKSWAMRIPNKIYMICVALILMVSACAGGMSKQARSQVDYYGSFADLQRQPDKHLQKTVLLGGKIIQTKPLGDTTEIIVLQLELSSQDRPQDNDRSQGRFLAVSKEFLDPAILAKGTLVTIIGRLTAVDEREIGEMSYRYPVIEINELKKWSAIERSYPRFHFGIGVGTHF